MEKIIDGFKRIHTILPDGTEQVTMEEIKGSLPKPEKKAKKSNK